MKLYAGLAIGLFVAACSAGTSSLYGPECADTGAANGGCTHEGIDSNIVFLKSRRYGGRYCGDRIKPDEVRVIDTESPGADALLEQAGPHVLLTEAPIGIESRGSQVATMKAAINSAASRGCNLLLTGPIESASWRSDSTGSTRPAATSRLERYLLVRMAKLQD